MYSLFFERKLLRRKSTPKYVFVETKKTDGGPPEKMLSASEIVCSIIPELSEAALFNSLHSDAVSEADGGEPGLSHNKESHKADDLKGVQRT